MNCNIRLDNIVRQRGNHTWVKSRHTEAAHRTAGPARILICPPDLHHKPVFVEQWRHGLYDNSVAKYHTVAKYLKEINYEL